MSLYGRNKLIGENDFSFLFFSSFPLSFSWKARRSNIRAKKERSFSVFQGKIINKRRNITKVNKSLTTQAIFKNPKFYSFLPSAFFLILLRRGIVFYAFLSFYFWMNFRKILEFLSFFFLFFFKLSDWLIIRL